MSPRPSRDSYSPLISSPLNPKGHAEISKQRSPKTPSPKASKRRTFYGDLSPTQRLLVQKAELAWSTFKEDDDDDGSDIYRDVNEEKSRCGLNVATRPDFARTHKAHWEEGAEGQDFFGEDAHECDGEEAARNGRRWSTSVLDLTPRLFNEGTGRSLLLAAGFMCLGGCLPVWAFMATGSPGLWSLGQAPSLEGANI